MNSKNFQKGENGNQRGDGVNNPDDIYVMIDGNNLPPEMAKIV